MTSYSVERPARTRAASGSRVRPGLVHLSPGRATTGQPVTVRTLDPRTGDEAEFPAVYVRADGAHMKCMAEDGTEYRRYLPSQVFPRREVYRRWAVTFVAAARPGASGPAGTEHPVHVMARTELEARFLGLRQVRAVYGGDSRYRLHLKSVRRAVR